MQIRNDFTSYSNPTYEHTYSPMDIENFLEEQATGRIENKGSRKKNPVLSPEKSRTENNKKNRLLFLKKFWDKLGKEEKADDRQEIPLSVKEVIGSHIQGLIHHVQAILQGAAQHKFVRRIAGIAAVIKTELSAALKKFKNGEGFLALSDERMPSDKNADTGQGRQRKKNPIEKNHQRPMADSENNHLADSYSKKGTYCKIGDNLTYQKEYKK